MEMKITMMDSEETEKKVTEPYQQRAFHYGMRIVEDQNWYVSKVTLKRVTIFMRSDKDLGYKVGKPLTFRWDGTGFIRQKQYLRPDGIY